MYDEGRLVFSGLGSFCGRGRHDVGRVLVPLSLLLLLGAGASACGGGGRSRSDASEGDARGADGGSGGGGGDGGGFADDAGPDGPAFAYSCGAFAVGSEWTTAPGFRSAVVAMGAPLSQPVAITFAGARFGDGIALVVDQGVSALFKIDTTRAADGVTAFVAQNAWPETPRLLTSIVWDQGRVFDGNLYVGDQGGDQDGDSSIYRVDPIGATTLFTRAPGPGLDDVYGLALLPAGGAYPSGLYAGGDTDGTAPGIGRYAADGVGTPFSTFAGVEGFAVDTGGRFGGGLFAALPMGGGYSGDDTISRINPDGTKGAALLTARPGIHAIVFSPPGPFGGDAYAASWQSGTILRILPDGTSTDLATGLSLTNYDGNILAFSPDGRVLLVADRLRSRIVCIEPS